ncbi:DUF6119 family protein [Fructobacillus fructosus]|uniref:DUF6119 family protein n=1 Tax=Fructobacillus fructosus TaxID=1631 RepID=UPI002D87124C|nr:hypothetical protein R54866_LGPIEIPA_00983 [Fructobacillus fructosus]CAK1244522.1 hypothetical protein LMG30235_GOPAMIKF_01092 [Fructobacillus fructosus]CAK1244811.1 hypothetical protein LMG30234_GAICNKDF_01085 [Fructobacillus fructosus]
MNNSFSKKSNYGFTIRLHKNINDYEDVIKSKIISSEDWQYYQKSDINSSYGLGKVFLSNQINNRPAWAGILESLSVKKLTIEENTYTKALIVFKLTNFKEPQFVSISIGYGDSLIDQKTVINDFGKVIAAKLIKNKNLTSVDTTQITDVILQSTRQIIGTKTNGIRSILSNRSEFPRKIQGFVKNQQTEFNVTGHNEVLKVTKKMTLNELSDDLEFYVKIYFDKRLEEASWSQRFTEITSKEFKNQLTEQLADSILNNSNDFAIAWPYQTEDSNYKIHGINNPEVITDSLSKHYLTYITQKKKLGPKQLATKLYRDRLIKIDKNNEEEQTSIMKSLISDIVFEDKRYLLFNGNWYQLSETFYKQILDEFSNVTHSELPFIPHIFGQNETKYNESLTQSFNKQALKENNSKLESKELHLSNYSNKSFARGTVEPADLVTRKKDFIFIKKGDSSANLSHLFLQGAVSAQLISEDNNFRSTIANKTFGSDWLNETTKKEDITIIFGIIRDEHLALPFFSMISFVEVVQQIKNMSFNVEVAWIGSQDNHINKTV